MARTRPAVVGAPEKPYIPDPELAGRYARNATYERAAIILREHPDVPVHPSIAALVPNYIERREALARELAKGRTVYDVPNEWGRNSGGGGPGAGSGERRPYPALPTPEDDAALAAVVASAVAEWGELRATELPPGRMSRTGPRSGIAVRSEGVGPEAVRTWAEWIGSRAAAEARQDRAAQLAAFLCLRPGPPQPGRSPVAGEATGGEYRGYPVFATELSRAMDVIPDTLPAPVPRGPEAEPVHKAPKAGKLAELHAQRAAVLAMAGALEE